MKTVFITIFEGIEGKNLLRTPVISSVLTDKNIRIVCFTKSEERAEYYRVNLPHERVIYEAVKSFEVRWIDRLFAHLRYYMLRTETTKLRAKMLKDLHEQTYQYYTKLFLHFILARKISRKIIRGMDRLMVKDKTYAKFFDKYNPDLLFTAQLFEELEVHFVKQAKARGVKTVSLVNSWDKVTARSAFRVLTDKFLVFNEIVKRELIDNNDVSEKDVEVVGIPQYDQFFNPLSLGCVAETFNKQLDQKPTREQFLKNSGIPEGNKFILYAPMGPAYSHSDWQIIDLLNNLATEKKFGEKVSIFVRFPPNDFVDMVEIKKRPNLHFHIPGHRFGEKRGTDWDMDFNDLQSLTSTLEYCEMVICYASSISIDSALFNKPIINLNFEIKESEHLIHSPTRFFGMEHYKNVLNTGAIKMVGSEEELIQTVNKYLEDKSLNEGERTRLVSEQAQFADGKSGDRIASIVKAQI